MAAIKQELSHHDLGPATDYLPLVRRVAQRLARRLPSHVALDDLLGAGVVGLLEAMDRFDPSRATEFSAYAEFRIKGAILDDLRQRDLMPRDARIEAKKVEAVVATLSHELGRPPEEEEVAQRLGMDLESLHKKLEKLIPVRVLELNESGQLSQLHDTRTPFDDAVRQQLLGRIEKAISSLSERHQQVVHLYYFESITLKNIGYVMDVSESRVCQILSSATLQLRACLREAGRDDAGSQQRGRGDE
jgi:RNA polymerase sigma factor for flagellar operon FliA